MLRSHLQTFLARADERVGPGLPAFVRRELYGTLDCGILANGFARVHCASCGRDELVAFSCKGRGVCPSCCGRRMAETAMHLVDEVLPVAPLRQWVLSFPYPVRLHLAYDARLAAGVRRIFVRVLFAWLRERAGSLAGRGGAVVVAQRFGSALNLNLHFHALVLDGVYSSSGPLARPSFHAVEPPTDRDVAELVTLLQRRILRYLARSGHPRRQPGEEAPGEGEEPLLAELYSASVQGRGVLTERDTEGVRPLRRRRGERPLSLPGELCASLEGFSLHAKVALEADDVEGRERLCRYLARPPLASERLSLADDGRVVYALRRHWKDGTRAVVFDPLDFIARLAALVPRPRTHLLTYHGVLAPAAEWRDWIVPAEPRPARRDPSQALAEQALRPDHARKRATWAELLKRVFEIDVLLCPWCGGKRNLIALITDGAVVRRILEHLGLPTTAPLLAPARSPPELEFAG